MRPALRSAVLSACCLLLANAAFAQHDEVSDDSASVSEGAQAELDRLDEAGSAGAQKDVWNGPRLEVGYEHFNLSDGHGGGGTHMAMFGGFLPVVPQLRAGLSLMGGIRDFSFLDNDLLLGARAIVGYQHVGWNGILPYVGATLLGGVIVGERFASSVVYGLVGLGAEAGLDVRIVNSFYAGFGVGYTRADLDGLAHDLLIIRFRVGL